MSALNAIKLANRTCIEPSYLRKFSTHWQIKDAGGTFYLTGPANPNFAALYPAADAKPLMPLFDQPLTDTSITVGRKGEFYLTGSPVKNDAGVFSSTITIWHSENMKRWAKVRELKLTDTEACSPEIHYLKETFWLTYSRKEGGTDLIRFDTADLAESTFHIACITAQGEDPSLFLDDDGRLYWVMGSGQISRLKDNPMDGLDEKLVQISITPEVTSPQRDPSTIVGTRGAFMVKIKGRYHLFATDRSIREGWGGPAPPVARTTPMWHRPIPFTLAMGTATSRFPTLARRHSSVVRRGNYGQHFREKTQIPFSSFAQARFPLKSQTYRKRQYFQVFSYARAVRSCMRAGR